MRTLPSTFRDSWHHGHTGNHLAGILHHLAAAAISGIIIAGATWPGTGHAKEETPEGVTKVATPKVSPHDSRDYRTLELDNGLEVLLVSDPEADKAAASMNVGVGSANDPDDLAGLAHLLEHMLFLGTDEYPAPDAYQSYLSRHGGNHNAFTATRDTNYFFDIEPDALGGALDRFSRFFIAPKFNADQLSSERNVVHSEYQSRLRDDGRRTNDVMNQLLNPHNPTTGFSVGSRETLADRPEGEPSLRERVIDFYHRFYDANVMQLAIVAPQPLDELETMTRTRFAGIADNDRERVEIKEPLAVDDELPIAANMHSLRDSRSVRFAFPIPDPQRDYRTKPAAYLANLLGHEGEGSLLAELRDAGLADGLSAGTGRSDGNHALFTIDISLTPKGAEQLPRIQATLFDTIDLIKEKGLDEWRYDEQARLAEQDFRFQQHGSTLQSAMRLSMNLAYYPLEDVNYAPYRMDGYDTGQIETYLDALTPDNLIRLYSGPDVEGNQQSPWFQASYEIVNGTDTSVTALSGLELPPPNPYIAKDLTLLDVQDDVPQQRIDDESFTFWLQADSTFSIPKVEWRFSLQHPDAAKSAKEAVLARLLAGWLGDSLNETFYPARLAGQSFDPYAHSRGITLAFSGWRDRQELVMHEALSQLVEGEIQSSSVERVRHRLERNWRNEPQDALYRQANRTLSQTLVRPQWPTDDLLDAISELNADDVREYRRHFLDNLRIESMAIGNITAEQAASMARVVADTLEPRLGAQDIPRLVPLAIDHDLPELHPQTSREESVVLRYLQGADRSLASQAIVSVLGQLIDTPFYDRLRTEQQLGYVVNAGYSPMLDAPGLSLLVQSPDTDSEQIQSHIDAFLEEFGKRLDTLGEEELNVYRQAVRDRLLQRDTSLGERTNRLWYALAYGDTDFDRRERLAARVMEVTQEELRDAWQRLRNDAVVDVTFDPGDEPTDVLELTTDLKPLPEE
ncbi:insulinase family protein [Aidingimonas lacisalsi]|uniref:insulinase family protein n=1 Tax=Aidingimonas lacisalsi TaxID=2604086 RepID=UPI0011D2AEC2|nr:insulinase family protein [Aidingimonas lacisalsi]